MVNGQHRVNQILSNTIVTFTSAFPERIRACYIQGSYADDTAVQTSDVDLLIIFKDIFRDEEQQHAASLAKQCMRGSSIELDIELDDEQHLVQGITPTFKDGSSLLWGDDIRDTFPLIPLIAWTRDRMHSSLWRTAQLFGRSGIVTYPMSYPDPQGEFYGYDARLLQLPDGYEVRCTRDLIRLTGWSATAILVYKVGVYVARKRDCHHLYQKYFDDEWGQLLQDIYELCRKKWNYLLPEDKGERLVLCHICEYTRNLLRRN